MKDRETVIESLQYMISENCTETQFDYTDDIEAAIAMLKEQKKMAEMIETLKIEIDILAQDISTNNCNTCKRQCEYRPTPGEVVRANCFMWDGADGERKG